jgi:hypothetical protein
MRFDYDVSIIRSLNIQYIKLSKIKKKRHFNLLTDIRHYVRSKKQTL